MDYLFSGKKIPLGNQDALGYFSFCWHETITGGIGVIGTERSEGGGTLFIDRVNQPDERQRISIGVAQLVKGAFYDLARANASLTPGGTYSIAAGNRQVVFEVDANAKPGVVPVIGRLVRIQPGA